MNPENWNGWVRYSTLGIEMALIVGVSVWAGVALDRRRQATFPLLTLIFTFLGLVIAIIRLVRGAK